MVSSFVFGAGVGVVEETTGDGGEGVVCKDCRPFSETNSHVYMSSE